MSGRESGSISMESCPSFEGMRNVACGMLAACLMTAASPVVAANQVRNLPFLSISLHLSCWHFFFSVPPNKAKKSSFREVAAKNKRFLNDHWGLNIVIHLYDM